MSKTDAIKRAHKFLAGERLKFEQANALWKQLKEEDQLSLARRVLEQMRRRPDCLSDGVADDGPINDTLCREEALLTSKDPELNAATRHDDALKLLARRFNSTSIIRPWMETGKRLASRAASASAGGTTLVN